MSAGLESLRYYSTGIKRSQYGRTECALDTARLADLRPDDATRASPFDFSVILSQKQLVAQYIRVERWSTGAFRRQEDVVQLEERLELVH